MASGGHNDPDDFLWHPVRRYAQVEVRGEVIWYNLRRIGHYIP
jgi:hypothetical protein